MEETYSSDDEINSKEHVDAVTSPVISPPLTPAPKKSKTQADWQREYRLRLKQKMLENGDKPAKRCRADYMREYRLRKKPAKKRPKKSAADYQREYRLRKKKRKAELNSNSAEMISRQGAGPSGYLASETLGHLTPSSPDARPIIIQHEAIIETVPLPTAERKKRAQEQVQDLSKARKFKSMQQHQKKGHNGDEILQLPSQSILIPPLQDDGMRQISNQHVGNSEFDEAMQLQDLYNVDDCKHSASLSEDDSNHSYTDYSSHQSAHKPFKKKFVKNSFGRVRHVCDRLWFLKDLKTSDEENLLKEITVC